METLEELLSPIPLYVPMLVVFAVIILWIISRSFRLPEDFALKEAYREEVRYRLFDKEMVEQEEKKKREEMLAMAEGNDGNDDDGVDADEGKTPNEEPKV